MSRYLLVDVPVEPVLPERLAGTFRWRWRARLARWTLIRMHRSLCQDWPDCSSLWRYEIRPEHAKQSASRGDEAPPRT